MGQKKPLAPICCLIAEDSTKVSVRKFPMEGDALVGTMVERERRNKSYEVQSTWFLPVLY
jgi:hypothetical protein